MKTKSARCEEILSKLEKISGMSFEQETPEGDLILLVEDKNLEALHFR